MLEMPIRTGRRVQDATRQIRETIARRTGERQQVNSLHRQRMTCSDSMRTFTNTQDWTNGMGISPSGRFQVIEEARPKRKAISRDGIRWDVAWIIVAAIVLLCGAILVADLAGISISSRTIGRLDSKIADMTKRNDLLKQELELSASDVSVCTEAVKLNLISGYGAQTITLTAPQEISSGAITAELRSGSTGWTTSSFGEN
ncbi:MAG: hypothetical protein IJQ71_03600 [Clostridia bacterium]|jgi:hypothetical protein|nr:hypothetical protein [Clostridia bacterium]